MTNKLSTIGLFVSGIVFGFLIFELFNPTSSLFLFVSMVAMAVVGLAFAILGIRQGKSALSITSLIIGAIAAGLISVIFLIMFIMGIGA